MTGTSSMLKIIVIVLAVIGLLAVLGFAATLNQLYCWCGCENTGEHRSNLQCFEDKMAVTCAVCRGTAEIAYDMTQKGITDAGKIQAAVDVKWAPKG